jgi:preprotein translocase subunit SecE
MAIEQRPSAKASPPGVPEHKRTLIVYVQEAITELKKTTWPTKQEATRLTALVIGVIVVLGIYMGLLDVTLSWLVNKFSLIK